MKDTPAIELEQVVNGNKVALKSIYRDAGIDLDIRENQIDLPRRDEVSLADLHAMMSAFRSLKAPPDVMHVHALVLTQNLEDAGVLGAMFDFGEDDVDSRPREGFAVFANAHESLPAGQNPELLLTLAHELAHCFNLHHPDWEGGPGSAFNRQSTIEGYSPANSVQWTLSANSKMHLRDDPAREVWPGRTNVGFGYITEQHQSRHQPFPSGVFTIVDPRSFKERRPLLTATSAGRRITQRDRAAFRSAKPYAVQLELKAPKERYVASEPIVLEVGLHNSSNTNQSVLPLLDPKFQFLNIEIRRPGRTEFEIFQPVVLADARGVQPHVLPPGESLHGEARVFFGAGGWVFQEAGWYEIRADYPAPAPAGREFADSGRLESNVIKINVVDSSTGFERRAQHLLTGDQKGFQEGLFLLFGGGDHLRRAVSNLRKVVTEAPTAAQAPAVRLALGTAALDPSVDATSEVESPPRLEEAQNYLRTTLNAQLSPLSVAKAQAELVEALEDQGRRRAAARVRSETFRQLRKYESAQEELEAIRQPAQSGAPRSAKPTTRPPQ